MLAAGVLWPRRERIVVLGDGDGGRLAARTRVVRQIAAAVAGQVQGVMRARVRVRPFRLRSGGRIVIDALGSEAREREEIERAARESLEHLATPFELRPRVRVRTRGEG